MKKPTMKNKKIITITIGFICIIATVVIGLFKINQAKKDMEQQYQNMLNRNSKYSVSIDKAESGIIYFNCNLIENSRTCSEKTINGSFTQSEEKIQPEFDGADVTLQEDQKFEIKFNIDATKSTEEIADKTVLVYFRDENENKFYQYTLLVKTKLSNDDIVKLQKIEEYEANEAAKKTKNKQP